MKAYMGYSRCSGPGEGAVLIFANNSREAKVVGWKYSDITDSYIDFGVNLIGEQAYHLGMAKKQEPHVIDCVPCCCECEKWGEVLGDDGLCDQCRCDLEDEEEDNEGGQP